MKRKNLSFPCRGRELKWRSNKFDHIQPFRTGTCYQADFRLNHGCINELVKVWFENLLSSKLHHGTFWTPNGGHISSQHSISKTDLGKNISNPNILMLYQCITKNIKLPSTFPRPNNEATLSMVLNFD
ncbi:hypothetical protein Dsin_008810 [Dipteronia sinensis]|uniref:Uncharacterized protein n=1 Tax=Dipteronia sinensis TaxID=43782 RepID=A0AAE0DWJ4_9ROSI|nr:hypothetical protein Dsin_024992 [Dipteronia sinensis]KAK3221785.1 hypothetical protein Dsin_008810 [Dipteronia sinensis]